MIRFQCQSCGASFDVAPQMAGRTGRCRNCGARMKVPANGSPAAAPESSTAPRPQPAAVGGGLRLAPLSEDAPARPAPSIPSRPVHWLEAVNSQVALAPISMDHMKALRPGPSPLDEPSIPGPYQVATAPSLPALRAARGKPAGAVTRGYRRGMGSVQKLFRWLNESAYLLSVPFLMCILLGLAFQSHTIMVLGATVVVLLNLGRIVAGVANLVVIPFRESPLQGVLFLIPPITFIYLAQNWNKVRRPVKRIIGPLLTIGLVVLAFVLEPWIKGEGKPEGSIREQARAGMGSMKEAVKSQLGGADGLGAIEQKAGAVLKRIQSSDMVKSLKSQPGESGKTRETGGTNGPAASNPR